MLFLCLTVDLSFVYNDQIWAATKDNLFQQSNGIFKVLIKQTASVSDGEAIKQAFFKDNTLISVQN